MKSLQNVQKELQDAMVIPIDEFINMIRNGTLSGWDGIGMLHDGERETDEEVDCTINYLNRIRQDIPYICWYSK